MTCSSATVCLTCGPINSIAYYFYLSQCLTSCPNGYFANTATNQCQICHSYCLTCTGPLSNNCQSCANDTAIMYYKDASSTKCASTCPVGQYKSADNVCSLCDSFCSTCLGTSINCSACVSPYYLQSLTCVTTCASNYFSNSTTRLCTLCPTGCLTCTGGTLSACLSCTSITLSNGTLVSYYKQPTGTQCSTTCPNLYFPNTNTNICDGCNNGCATCQTTPTNCLTCTTYQGNTFYKSPASNTCIMVCPEGYFGNATTFNC
jgi:proprotein convertase subtilisin/kexin type 5